MYPILGRYGPFFFYSYTAAMGVGLLLALGLTAWRARQQDAGGRWLDGCLIGLLTALIGGRLAYVAANWAYFQAHTAEAWLVWRGGLSYHGAVLTGLLALWIWCRRHGRHFGRIGGLLAPGAALWTAFGWLACYLEGCAHGRETFLGPLAANLPDTYGVFAVRYQTQLLGLALSLLVLMLLWLLRRRLGLTALFWATVCLLSGSRVVVSLLRGDAMPLVGSLRVDTILDAGLALLAAVALLVTLYGSRAQPAGKRAVAPGA